MKNHFSLTIAAALATSVVCVATSCSSATKTSTERTIIRERAHQTVNQFKNEDPTMSEFFDSAYGYAVFPTVSKGGAIVGGAHGNGVLYEQGVIVGYCELSQASIGAQLGGQKYSEIIFFETSGPLEELKAGDLEFSAQASAVAAEHGASANADYDHGVAVFTMGQGGLMLEASIGGQQFKYTPMSAYND